MAVVTTGVGGYDQLVVSRVPIPVSAEGEVLVQVLAAGMNNTEINTRLGWYSSSVTTGTADASEDVAAQASTRDDGGWYAVTPFPLIQGADCCGRIAAVGPGGDSSVIGARVLIRACMRTQRFSSWETAWLGSDLDAAFAQFVAVPVHEVFTVACDWSDAELANRAMRLRYSGEHGRPRRPHRGSPGGPRRRQAAAPISDPARNSVCAPVTLTEWNRPSRSAIARPGTVE